MAKEWANSAYSRENIIMITQRWIAPAIVLATFLGMSQASAQYLPGQFLPGQPQTPVTQIFKDTISVREAHQLMVSLSPDRSNASALEGQTFSGSIYVFIDPSFGIVDITPRRAKTKDTGVVDGSTVDFIRFYYDDPNGVEPFNIEGLGPYDFAGTGAGEQALPFNTLAQVDGDHTISAEVVFTDGSVRWVSSTFSTIGGQGPGEVQHELMLSQSPARSFSSMLDSQTVFGDIYVFLSPEADVATVSFLLDGVLQTVEGTAPFDFNGAFPDSTPIPLDTTTLTEGLHNITANLQLVGGATKPVTADFTVNNTQPRLQFAQQFITVETAGNGTTSTTIDLTTSDGAPAVFALSEELPWLEVSPVMGNTPQNVLLDFDLTGLPEGTYFGTVAAAGAGLIDGLLNITLQIGPAGGCTPVACEDILVDLPYELDFESNHGFLKDGFGRGTGFTYVDVPTNGTGLINNLFQLDAPAGELRIDTTPGIMAFATNSQDNALGVGIDAPSQLSVLHTTLLDPPLGTNNYEQAGLWFGLDEDNYVKCAYVSSPGGTQVQFFVEENGVETASFGGDFFDPTGIDVELVLKVDPFDQTIRAEAGLDGGSLLPIGIPVSVPDEFFSFDAAGIDPTIGTRSFGGIFATHRNGPAPLTFRFGDFSVTEGPSLAATGDLDFIKTSFPMPKPTAMAWAPDNRLYVTNVNGNVHAFTLDADNAVVDEEIITRLVDFEGENRLTLGIAVDPFSTPGDVILYLAHSNANQGAGEINSGRITKISGSSVGFDTAEQIITGLPRALANHSLNAIHFGSDLRLYIASAGITGAGAAPDPLLVNTEFGDREEQPLSAAVLVADIFSPTFDGTCDNSPNIFAPNPCDVVTYSTGLRNTYDFVLHSNGEIYATDNGLGVTGTFPPSPTGPCPGYGDPDLWDVGGDNPGPQLDLLLRLQENKYYGHPNPSRGECVFKDGSYQGVAAPANYEPALFDLELHRSANGIAEYPFDVGCVQLGGDLLIANYSSGDDLTRVKLTPDGLGVLASDSFVGGFNDPLPVLVGPAGTIFVGEFGGDVISALVPRSLGCWNPVAQAVPLPEAVLDAGGAGLDGKFYMVAGKVNGGVPINTVRVFDPATDSWGAVADLPGEAVENPAVCTQGGKLYVFGGSEMPFSDAVTNAAVFNPGTGLWTPLAPMGSARGGATARAMGDKIYVTGGMDAAGNSQATAEVYDTLTDSWTPISSMITRRDNAGSAVFDGKFYVFGGRTRNADNTTIDGTLASAEMYDPVSDTWVPRAPMPTGRRTFVVGLLDGKAQIMGGEATELGGAFAENEEYDAATDTWRVLQKMDTPRHGAAGGTVGSTVYVAGGGLVAGSSFTDVTEAFGF